MKIYNNLIRQISSPDIVKHTDKFLGSEAGTILDIGCGTRSILEKSIKYTKLVGLDVLDRETATNLQNNVCYLDCNVTDFFSNINSFKVYIEEHTGVKSFNTVSAFNVIEHLDRENGEQLLSFMEAISERFIILETPCGFVPQGPEFGNPYQRHLSGWFPHDFEARGYTVTGSLGTRLMRGYMGEPKLPIPGMRTFDNVILSRLLNTKTNPQRAFNICAFKDKLGVPARYE